MSYIYGLESSVSWLTSLTIGDLENLIPDIIELHQFKFSSIKPRNNQTLLEFFREYAAKNTTSETQDLLEILLFSLKKPSSQAICDLINGYREGHIKLTPREFYELWVLSKLTLDQYPVFGFK